jgi:hypothetical protein
VLNSCPVYTKPSLEYKIEKLSLQSMINLSQSDFISILVISWADYIRALLKKTKQNDQINTFTANASSKLKKSMNQGK